jgi:hypothetical protein
VGGVAQILYKHASKCKNDKTKFKKSRGGELVQSILYASMELSQ